MPFLLVKQPFSAKPKVMQSCILSKFIQYECKLHDKNIFFNFWNIWLKSQTATLTPFGNTVGEGVRNHQFWDDIVYGRPLSFCLVPSQNALRRTISLSLHTWLDSLLPCSININAIGHLTIIYSTFPVRLGRPLRLLRPLRLPGYGSTLPSFKEPFPSSISDC